MWQYPAYNTNNKNPKLTTSNVTKEAMSNCQGKSQFTTIKFTGVVQSPVSFNDMPNLAETRHLLRTRLNNASFMGSILQES